MSFSFSNKTFKFTSRSNIVPDSNKLISADIKLPNRLYTCTCRLYRFAEQIMCNLFYIMYHFCSCRFSVTEVIIQCIPRSESHDSASILCRWYGGECNITRREGHTHHARHVYWETREFIMLVLIRNYPLISVSL